MASFDPELEAMKRRMREMEEEASKLREMQAAVEREMLSTTSTHPHAHSWTPPSPLQKSILVPSMLVMWIILPHPKNCKPTFKHVVPSIELPFSVTSTPEIPKDLPMSNLGSREPLEVQWR